jgi:uncharacterized protein
MKTKLVVIQPTPFCNIHCRYCYLSHRSSTKRISLETLNLISRQLFSSPFISDAISIVWHAGEPLVLPVSFYRQAFQHIQQYNVNNIQVKHSFQTNATLITKEWCDFFKEQGIQVGVSLDGPQHMHDANRIDRAGRGTFERTMHGVKLLQENGIKFSAIMVITKDSIECPEEIWRFIAAIHPTRVGFNVEESEGINIRSSLHTEGAIEQYKKFFKRILELNAYASDPLIIRESETLLRHIKIGSDFTRSQTNVPTAILSFDCEGNISTFSPELLTMTDTQHINFVFGNVYKDALEEVFHNEKFTAINNQIQNGVLKCKQTCDYFMFCGGGSPSNKMCENGTFDSTETRACQLRVKAATDAMLEFLEEYYDIPVLGR